MINLTLLFLAAARYSLGTTLSRNYTPVLATNTNRNLETTSLNSNSISQIFLSKSNTMENVGENPSHQEGETPTFNKLHIRGGPGKIQAIMKSASDAQESRDKWATEHEADNTPVEVRGGPGKAEAVMESASIDGEQKVPEVRGGPGKAEAVMESAGVGKEQGKPVVRGGPGKIEGVMASAGMELK
jgi:hypothetical protein